MNIELDKNEIDILISALWALTDYPRVDETKIYELMRKLEALQNE